MPDTRHEGEDRKQRRAELAIILLALREAAGKAPGERLQVAFDGRTLTIASRASHA